MLHWRSLTGTLLALLLFELLLRQLARAHPTIDRYGWGYHDQAVINRLLEGWGVSHWDASAVRAAPPSNGAKRILFVGDSYTEGLQVDDGETFAARTQGLAPGIRTINIGRSAQSIADYVAFGPEYVERFHPDWTIIAVESKDLGSRCYDPGGSHFVWHGAVLQPVVVTPPRIWQQRLQDVRRASDLVDYGIRRWSLYRTLSARLPLFRAADVKPKSMPAEVITPVEQQLALLFEAFHGRLTLVFLPDFGAPVPIERRTVAECARRGWSCVNLRESFPSFAAAGDAPYGFPNSTFGEGHLNARGHAAVARLLAPELERLQQRGLF